MNDRLIYFLKDKVSGVKTQCFMFQNDAVALRSLNMQIRELMNKKDSVSLSLLSDAELFKFDELNDQVVLVKVKDLGEIITLPSENEPGKVLNG